MKISNTDIQNASLQELKEIRDFVNDEINRRDIRRQILRDLCAWISYSEEQS